MEVKGRGRVRQQPFFFCIPGPLFVGAQEKIEGGAVFYLSGEISGSSVDSLQLCPFFAVVPGDYLFKKGLQGSCRRDGLGQYGPGGTETRDKYGDAEDFF